MPKTITIFVKIAAVIICAASSMIILAWSTISSLDDKTGFSRIFANAKINPYESQKRPANVTGVISATHNGVYFRTNNPANLYYTDADLANGMNISLKIQVTPVMRTAYSLSIDSPNVSVMAGNAATIVTNSFSGNTLSEYKFPPSIFTKAVKISNTTYILRGFSSNKGPLKAAFFKVNTATQEWSQEILPFINDSEGGFSSDGHLNYDSKTSSVAYVSYYTNNVYCLDTNLNLKYNSHTVDTFTSVKVETSTLGGSSQKSLTNELPMKVINNRSCAYDGHLYIASKIKADNDPKSLFFEMSPIDVYDLKNGAYKYSFYIPNNQNEKFVDFKVSDGRLFVLYKNNIVAYRYQNP